MTKCDWRGRGATRRGCIRLRSMYFICDSDSLSMFMSNDGMYVVPFLHVLIFVAKNRHVYWYRSIPIYKEGKFQSAQKFWTHHIRFHLESEPGRLWSRKKNRSFSRFLNLLYILEHVQDLSVRQSAWLHPQSAALGCIRNLLVGRLLEEKKE